MQAMSSRHYQWLYAVFTSICDVIMVMQLDLLGDGNSNSAAEPAANLYTGCRHPNPRPQAPKCLVCIAGDVLVLQYGCFCPGYRLWQRT